MSDADPTERLVLEERLVEVEVRAAYQEHTIAELNEVLIAQATRIEQLELRIELLASRLRETPLGSASAEPDPPPPHY